MGMFDDAPDLPVATQTPGGRKKFYDRVGAPSVDATPPEVVSPLTAAARGMGSWVPGVSHLGGLAEQYVFEGGDPAGYQRGYERSAKGIEQAAEQQPDAYFMGRAAPFAVAGGFAKSVPLALLRWGIGKVMGGRGIAQNAQAIRQAAEAARTQPGGGGFVNRTVDALMGETRAPAPGTAPRAPPRGSGTSPHERINSIADALRKNREGTLTPEQYMQRAATYTRRGGSYQHRANVQRDYPEAY